MMCLKEKNFFWMVCLKGVQELGSIFLMIIIECCIPFEPPQNAGFGRDIGTFYEIRYFLFWNWKDGPGFLDIFYICKNVSSFLHLTTLYQLFFNCILFFKTKNDPSWLKSLQMKARTRRVTTKSIFETIFLKPELFIISSGTPFGSPRYWSPRKEHFGACANACFGAKPIGRRIVKIRWWRTEFLRTFWIWRRTNCLLLTNVRSKHERGKWIHREEMEV